MEDSFEEDNKRDIAGLAKDTELQRHSAEWVALSARHRYSYHFKWMGRPIIQYPQDIIALQEIIWSVKPDLIVETGVARGGSLIFSASILELVGGDRLVVGVDVDIRAHNRIEIEKHPMAKRIRMIQGSSIDESTMNQVRAFAEGKRRIMVILDSNHTHDHVLQELELYSPLVSKGSYLVAMDTIVEDIPEELVHGRPWGKGNNPKTAVWEFLKGNKRFVIDEEIENKLLITVAPDGYLKCIED
jgi:cephalosporin hydroxylase